MTALQAGLWSAGAPAPAPSPQWDRVDLGRGSWLEVCRGWMVGGDAVYASLAASVPWRQRRRRMYDRVVDEPRLVRWYGDATQFPDPLLAEWHGRMADRYRRAFGPVGLNYYRDGSDSVALHADRELRHLHDTLVVILTFGATRPFLVKPAGGGASIDLRPASGDVVVMGGACQLHFLHGVPKVAASGPRISASIRWAHRDGPVVTPPAARRR